MFGEGDEIIERGLAPLSETPVLDINKVEDLFSRGHQG